MACYLLSSINTVFNLVGQHQYSLHYVGQHQHGLLHVRQLQHVLHPVGTSMVFSLCCNSVWDQYHQIDWYENRYKKNKAAKVK